VVYICAGGGVLKLDGTLTTVVHPSVTTVVHPSVVSTVVHPSGHSATDGLIVLPGNSSARGDRSLRLLWCAPFDILYAL